MEFIFWEKNMNREKIKELESEVKSYCRKYDAVFTKAKGSYLYDDKGHKYLDFLAGAGAINYGHNNDFIKKYIVDYINEDGLMHGLDLYTKAKEEFMETFETKILRPRKLDYKIQFTGPTGTNAVEAALKLARKVKKRNNIIAFSGAFHGMTLGSLSATSDTGSRNGAFLPLTNVSHLPYPGSVSFDTLEYLKTVLDDDHSGIDKPAAILVETIQAEGGVNVAPVSWLKGLEKICHEYDILLIVDDIQVGNSRTGYFFSFERAKIKPDMVTLSKSISGYGLPMALLLLKPELDIWHPAEHNGTFRGNQLAFVGAKAAIEYNINNNLSEEVTKKGEYVEKYIKENILSLSNKLSLRGMGLIWGIDFSKLKRNDIVKEIIKNCFKKKLIIESAGRGDLVLKILCPLTISYEELDEGLKIICEVIKEVL